MARSGSLRQLLRVVVIGLLCDVIERSAASENADAMAAQLDALAACKQSTPLGMISKAIQDWQITSSSVYPAEWDKGCAEKNARVYLPNGLGWCARYKSNSEWLQIDLGVLTKVTSLMTQGRGDGKEWVTSFSVSYSALDIKQWQYITDQYGNRKIFEGNADSYSVQHAYLDEPIIARYVKFHTLAWNRHPSMRVEIMGCQVCNSPIGLPPFGKITASGEKGGSSTCRAVDGYILTNKAWCAKKNNGNQWLQFDVGPPTLITGVVTKGRGDGKRNQWVMRYKLSYSNDSNLWYFYKDSSHVEVKRQWNGQPVGSTNDSSVATFVIPDQHRTEGLEFGANMDADTERYHYLNVPFVARYIRFHPVQWKHGISMRAGLIGCPQNGNCAAGFMRVNDYTPCVENLAFHKESWVSNRRQLKRHVRNQWKHGQADRAVDGHADQSLDSCTVLDNFDVDKPVWMVNLGRKLKISGVMIHTWIGIEHENRTAYRDYMYNLDKLVIYADNKGGKTQFDLPENQCGSISRVNDALFKPRLHVPCRRPIRARYIYVEAWGVPNRNSRLFSAILCEVMVYE